MHEDDHQDKATENNVGEKIQPDESDPVVIMARQLQLSERRLSEQDQFNELLLGKMTRMEDIMTALTKMALDVQAPPTINAPKKANLKRESPSDMTQHLKDKVEKLMKITEKISRKQSGAVSDSEEEDTEPCVKRIIDAPLSERFKMPRMELYEGQMDPRDHLSKYSCIMPVAKASDDAKCLYFSLTLSKSVEDWWKRLSLELIHN
uniref:Uncharacterized protein n=1 Tax=Cannabis sativa TaxID=3483 RepID=A0A803P5E8_CANSA